MQKEDLLKILAPVGQSHLLRFWDELTPAQRQNLSSQITSQDWTKIMSWVRQALGNEQQPIPFSQLQPAPYLPLQPRNETEKKLYADARERGRQLLSGGMVAAFTVAGGQGTRLGFDGPKGTFSFTPLRQASLFQFFAEGIARYQEKYQIVFPWYIMTSPANDLPTRQFFEQHAFFGLEPKNVFFLQQGMLPAFDFQGKALLAEKDSLALSANGHGGSFAALHDSGALQDMQRRGIRYLSYWQVDNPLVTLFDPLFLGLHEIKASEMSSRALIKRDSMEKLGHFCLLDGKTMIVEYSDMPLELLQQTDSEQQLRFRAGSPAIHILNCDFIQRLTADQPDFQPHRADKKVPCIAADGSTVTPAKPNAIKLEFFLFDAITLAKNPLILATDREEQFAPIKNATGEDSPQTCREALLARSLRWLQEAGVTVPCQQDGKAPLKLEISPRLAVEPSDLVPHVQRLSALRPGSELLLE